MTSDEREQLYDDINKSHRMHREIIARLELGQVVTSEEWEELRRFNEKLLRDTKRHVYQTHMAEAELPGDVMEKRHATTPGLDEDSAGKNFDKEPAANEGGGPSNSGISERKREEQGNTD